jgi:hypothetical protein
LLVTLNVQSRFDAIVLPVVQFDWPHDRSQLKKTARRLAHRVATHSQLSPILNRLLAHKAQTVASLDRFDTHQLATDFIQAFPTVQIHFKANLAIADRDAPREDGQPCFRFLPYWLATESYPDPGPVEKDIDILFLGAINSAERIEGQQVLTELHSQGYRVVSSDRRVSFQEYQRLTARSWLILSPQGFGYNGFRHYEAMLLRSVPVINLPDPPVCHDFVDGENCLLYGPSQLRDTLLRALADRHRLQQMIAANRDFALAHHSFDAVGRYIVGEILAAAGASSAAADPARLPRHGR